MQNDVVDWQHDELRMLASNNFMDITLREANADFLVAMLDVVNRTVLLNGLERLMDDDVGLLWESRAENFVELLQRWTKAGDEVNELAGVVRICCKWIGRWPWDERATRLLVDKLGGLEVEVANRILPEMDYRAVVKALCETNNRYVFLILQLYILYPRNVFGSIVFVYIVLPFIGEVKDTSF